MTLRKTSLTLYAVSHIKYLKTVHWCSGIIPLRPRKHAAWASE